MFSLLEHFEAHEFGSWSDKMDIMLLLRLDQLADVSGYGIRISKVNGAVGREDGNTWHNINFTGTNKVMAVDVYPFNRDGAEFTQDDAQRLYTLALRIGFTGVGIYPHWAGGIGFHLDTRTRLKNRVGRKYDEWAGVWRNNKQVYVSFNEGLELCR